MLRKTLIKYIAYFIAFSLFALTEKALGVTGLSVGFFFALVYCREKIYIAAPVFAGSSLAVSFSLITAINAAAGVVIAVVAAFIHYKKQLRYTILETSVLTLAAMVPTMVFSHSDPFSIAITALGVCLAEIFHYLGIIGMYPVLVRGLRYRLNPNEKFALGALVCALSVGLSLFRPFNISLFCLTAALSLSLLSGLERNSLPFFGVCAGLGAAVGEGDPAILAYLAVVSLICYGVSRLKSPVCAAAMSLGFAAITCFFNGKLDLWAVVPFAVGCFIGMLFPEKFYKKILSSRQGYRERFALRTVVNRDREDLSARLKNVAAAFYEMQSVLISEQPSDDSPDSVVRAVCDNGCFVCPRYHRCTAALGDVTPAVRKLVAVALDNGKATLLDAGVGLGENCVKLGFLLNLVNDSVKEYRRMQERKSGLEQGREMVVAQMGGVAELLTLLARSVNVNLTFDPEPELRLIERLGQANVVATDVCLYTDGEDAEITAVVRESDADKSCIGEIIGEIAGYPMTEYARAKDVKGMACLHYCRAPSYKVLYGETVSSKEARCGDTRQAVKLGRRKLMFVLSDGMGTGRDAFFTASHVIRLIETFYRAGFDHKTVFTNVARLLSLRNKEDFSALDVAIIDTQTGDIDFIKQGGRESYVFSGGEYEIIDGGALPMGIIADSRPVVERRRLKSDDLVILMSDGVADAFSSGEITQIIRKTSVNNPQNASDALVKDALRLSGGKKDDMTVIALRLVRAV